MNNKEEIRRLFEDNSVPVKGADDPDIRYISFDLFHNLITQVMNASYQQGYDSAKKKCIGIVMETFKP